FQCGRDRVVDAGLDLVQWNAGNVITGRDEDISIGIRRRIVGRSDLTRKLIGGIDKPVIDIEEPWRGLVLRSCLQTLSTGCRDVLEHAAALDDACDLDDVVLAVGSEQPEFPVQRALLSFTLPRNPASFVPAPTCSTVPPHTTN